MSGAYSGATGPSQARKVHVSGLEHHVLEWFPGGARAEAQSRQTGPTILLLHGYMDVAASWENVAAPLAGGGFRVLAPDFRGFGDGPRAAPGSYYYFSDYIADVAGLVGDLVDGPLFVVGHSMGGTVTTLYAGAFPECPSKIALLEGLGPPDTSFEEAPDRLRAFVEGSARIRNGPSRERNMASLEDVATRLAVTHPHIDRRILLERAPHLVRALPDGTLAWRFDPLHRARSPLPFYAAAFRSFASRIRCPVLAIEGGELGYHPPDEEERLASFKTLERATIENAGHMMHWTAPARVAELLLRFFAG